MNKNIFDPLDDEEKVLMEAIANDELIPVENETELKEKILFYCPEYRKERSANEYSYE